jgi:hypothetical protein
MSGLALAAGREHPQANALRLTNGLKRVARKNSHPLLVFPAKIVDLQTLIL